MLKRTNSLTEPGGPLRSGGAGTWKPQTREIELLYGESELPMYTGATRSFETVSTGWTPLYGHSGYEDKNDLDETIVSPNPYNAYTWTMDVAAGKLLLGTYDVRRRRGPVAH